MSEDCGVFHNDEVKEKSMTIADYIKESHETAVSKGWWEPEKRIKSLCESCGEDSKVDSLISICSVCLGAGWWIFTNLILQRSDSFDAL